MKNFLTFFGVLLISVTLSFDGFTQSFYTGAIGVTQSNGGRTRIYSDNLTTRQIERISILVGVSSDDVFDYNEDQDVLISAATVTTPLLSDFEVTSTINNSYSNLPPVVQASYNIYGWNNGAYLLFKATVKNNEASAINAVIGFEAIPRINGTYPNDTLQWDVASQTVLIHKSAYAGIRFLSSQQTSLELIPWTDPYANDSLYYTWLTQNSFDPLLIANSAGDGAVAVLGQDPVNINPGDSATFYFAVSIGANETEMLANMQLAQQKYSQITSVESDLNNIPSDFILEQNYPNPFNPSTKISFGLPQRSSVVLKVFNTLGEEVAELVNESLEAGTHSYNFDASKLTSDTNDISTSCNQNSLFCCFCWCK